MTTATRPAIVSEEHLTWLDELREFGDTNMFGAASWLAEAFGLGKNEAKIILAYWMDSFSERHPNA